jgi:N-formylglutamate amidohydrolase
MNDDEPDNNHIEVNTSQPIGAYAGFPPWVVIHVPHDSTVIPSDVRSQFLLTDEELQNELRLMTDHHTHDLFTVCAGAAAIVRAPVSRLVVDVERFADDALEAMAARGMGAIYQVTSSLQPLRRSLSEKECRGLLQAWYYPHHADLENVVESAVSRFGRCLVLDCHSFPSVPLPYEQRDLYLPRPNICIGTDSFHTNGAITQAFVDSFTDAGWSVAVNDPFSGALVPASRYRTDARVSAVMVEVNRSVYLNEADANVHRNFSEIAARVGACCLNAITRAFPA